MTNCTVSGNSANQGGGGICCGIYSSPTITNCTIAGNTTTSTGGAIHLYENSSPMLTNCTIAGNTAKYEGGGVYSCNDSSPTLINCTITDNRASQIGGGGIRCYYTSATLKNCTVSGNTTYNRGGGIFCTSGSPTIDNCTLTHNSASRGAGIHCYYYSSPVLRNCTIADNSASQSDGGGGIYCDADCSPTVKNSILWGDTANDVPDEISGPGTVTVTYCDVDQDGYAGSNHNIRRDPGFVPLDEDGNHTGYYLMHLGPQANDSACIDAGDTNASVYGLETYTTRTDGTTDDGTVDMGYHYPEGYSGSDDTYIELLSFNAQPQGSAIALTWETGAEIDNAGFIIYRRIAGTFYYQKVSDLIAAEGNASLGASYSFTDSNVEAGVSYDYWLVDIDRSGKWTPHGPASARLPIRFDRLEIQFYRNSLEKPSYNRFTGWSQ